MVPATPFPFEPFPNKNAHYHVRINSSTPEKCLTGKGVRKNIYHLLLFTSVLHMLHTPAPVRTIIFLHSCSNFTASSIVLISFLFFLFGGSERILITICHNVISSNSGGGIVSGSKSLRIVRGSVPIMRCCWTKAYGPILRGQRIRSNPYPSNSKPHLFSEVMN